MAVANGGESTSSEPEVERRQVAQRPAHCGALEHFEDKNREMSTNLHLSFYLSIHVCSPKMKQQCKINKKKTPTFAVASMCLALGPSALEVALDVGLGADITHQLTFQRLTVVEE